MRQNVESKRSEELCRTKREIGIAKKTSTWFLGMIWAMLIEKWDLHNTCSVKSRLRLRPADRWSYFAITTIFLMYLDLISLVNIHKNTKTHCSIKLSSHMFCEHGVSFLAYHTRVKFCMMYLTSLLCYNDCKCCWKVWNIWCSGKYAYTRNSSCSIISVSKSPIV